MQDGLETNLLSSDSNQSRLQNVSPKNLASSSGRHCITSFLGTSTPFSFSSSSATAIKKLPHCVNVKQRFLTKRGYESFEDWKSDPNHVYNGRDMSHHVPGALGSDWGNPYKVASNASKKSRIRSLKRYEDHIRKKS